MCRKKMLWMRSSKNSICIQARIVQLVVYRLGTGEVQGSNPGKGDKVVDAVHEKLPTEGLYHEEKCNF